MQCKNDRKLCKFDYDNVPYGFVHAICYRTNLVHANTIMISAFSTNICPRLIFPVKMRAPPGQRAREKRGYPLSKPQTLTPRGVFALCLRRVSSPRSRCTIRFVVAGCAAACPLASPLACGSLTGMPWGPQGTRRHSALVASAPRQPTKIARGPGSRKALQPVQRQP